VIKKEKIGFSSITNTQDLKLLVNSALKAALFGQKACFKFPTLSEVSQVKCFDPAIPSISVEQMVEEGEKAIKTILKEFPSFQCEVELNKTVARVSILNSSGLNFTYRKSIYAFSIYAFLAQEGDFLGVGEEEVSCRYQDWSLSLAQRIIEKISLTQKKASIQTGTYPVLFTSKAMPLVLYPLKKGINGKLVHKKISPLSFRLNEPIFSSLVSIVDDATFPYAKASSPVDGEGVPSRPNPVIEKGVLKNFVYDLQTAGLMKTRTTANGLREYDSLPSPSTTNFIVSPGEVSLEEMIRDMREGLIVDQVIGAGQSNVLMGEFSVNLDLGFKVEGGKIVGRVKNVMASGNIYDLLKNVVAVGKEAQFVGSTFTPPFCFKRVYIAG
jgi:PmbA protein